MSATNHPAESAPTPDVAGRATEIAARAPLDGFARSSDGLPREREGLPRRHRRGWLVRRALVAADVVGLLAAFFGTELLFNEHLVGGLGLVDETAIFIASLPVWVVAAKLYGLYDRDEERATHSTADDVVNVFHLITVGVWFFYATSWFVGLAHPNQAKLTSFWLFAVLAVIGLRLAARALARRQPAYVQNALIVGAGDVGQLIARKVLQHPEYRINLVGFADAEPKQLRRDVGDVQVLGGVDDVVEAVRGNDIDRVVVAFSRDDEDRLLHLIRALRAHDIQIDVVPRLFDTVGPNSALHSIEGLPLLSVASVRISRSSRLLKRCIDIAGAAALLVLTAPLLLVIGWLVRRDSPGPALFRQTRLGIDMRRFTLFKFRTMQEGTDEGPHRAYLEQIMRRDALPAANNLYKLERSAAVTRVGRWLRRTSLDELPQLLNVLRGDMSLVGPRPAIPYEVELYAAHHLERFAVPAGLTGLWQVEARAHATFQEALELDVAYARGWSIGLDLRLLLRTPLLMFRKRETG
jgi:exopolysaccharide biosynthesis polyprenyl glycosylphosphotransferase